MSDFGEIMEQIDHAEQPIRSVTLEIQIQELRARITSLETQISNLIRIATPSNPPGDAL